MTTTPTRIIKDVEAADLRLGDWVLEDDGEVSHGVFDLHVGKDTQKVTVYTRLADQRFGWPPAYQVPPTTRYRISRITR